VFVEAPDRLHILISIAANFRMLLAKRGPFCGETSSHGRIGAGKDSSIDRIFISCGFDV
jgi:hypothetical protein